MLTFPKMYIEFTQDKNGAIEVLRRHGWRVGFAESCTGGRLSALWAETPGVSEVFTGSVVSYANQVKTEVLAVGEKTLAQGGAVSMEVATEMARGLKDRLHLDWAVSVTGIAGPGGGSPTKPVGTVCFAAVGPGVEEARQQNFSGDRVEIQNAAVVYATRFLRELLMRS